MFKKNFNQKVKEALGVFNKTKDELSSLNKKMNAEIGKNQTKINEMQKENDSMRDLIDSNANIISNISTILNK